MSSGHTDDVLVIGAGAVGLACALYLLEQGRSVRLIEQNAVGSGSSHGNCGTITPSHAPPLTEPGAIRRALRWVLQPDAPLYVQPRPDPALAAWLLRFAWHCNRRHWLAAMQQRAVLLQAARHELEQLISDRAIACGFESSGLVYAFREAAEFEHIAASLDLLRELGIESETWDPARLASEEPALKPGMAGGILFPGDAQLRPEAFVAGLATRAAEAGAVIEHGCRVDGFDVAGGRIEAVHTAAGIRRGRDVVLAIGAWTPHLARQLGLRLPIQPGKGYSITYRNPPQPLRRPLVLKERAVCVTGWASGYRLGSTMEFAGYDERLNRTRLDALVRGASEYLHRAEGDERVEEWYGWRPMTCDDLPVLGVAPGLANLWLATGHGMLGITMSAATGRLLSELITERPPFVDPAPYSAARFR
jgi:D-amino-acid dehydrogenase